MGAIIIKINPQRVDAAAYSRARALIKYVDDPEKCTDKQTANMINEDGLAAQARELALACDAANPAHDRRLIHHHVVSFKPEEGEEITGEQLYDTAREYMRRLGFANCPQHMAIHRNTAHPHLHIVFAQVDAESGKILKMPLCHVQAQKTIAVQSKKYGWKLHARSRYAVEDGQLKKLTPPPREIPEELKTQLQQFCDANREKFARWKWANLHQALAEQGIGLEYRQADGLFASLDGKKWYKTAYINDEMTYPHLANHLNAKTYRKARPEILARLAEIRANGPALSCPEPMEAEQPQTTRQDATQTQGAPRAPEKEERKEMTDAQLQYLALLARERADERTRKTLEAMEKAANIDFYRRNEDILKALYDSRYTDADAYARLMHNATRYHLRRIAADEARRRRDDEETRRNRRQYAAFHAHAAQHATAGQDARRIAAIMMYRAGASASDIAARMVAGMMDENPAMMSASEYIADQIGEQIGAALDALTTEMLRERGRWERRDREIAKIEDAYADMSIHAPAEYREGMEERKQEAIAAARALAAWEERQERAAQREAQREAKKQQDQPPTPTAADARIFARHATEAEKTAPSKEKTNEMIALRLRACGHKADDAVRIMCAGMDIKAAVAAVASMYRTAHGDEMLRIARDCASQWRREEQGQTTIRHNGGATQAQRPAAAAAPRPRM